jgi:putative copper export protein
MDSWAVILFFHLLGIAFFVGGQLMLAIVVVPSLRGQDEALMRGAAKRFGIASVVALAVIVATGVAMASHYQLWDNSTLQAKLGLLVLVVVLAALHTVTPYTRAISITILLISIVIVWLGVDLMH